MKFNLLGTHSGDYGTSSVQITILSDDGRVAIGRAIRTGITPIYYPDRPVYRFVRIGESPLPRDGFFVFDGTEFHESSQWRRDHEPEAFEAMRKRSQA